MKIKNIISTSPSNYGQVKDFMTTFRQECPDELTMPNLEIRKLLAKLILEEIHRSNMTKLWTKPEYLKGNLHKCIIFNTTSMNLDEMSDNDRVYLIVGNNGKVIKSPSYSPPALNDILHGKTLPPYQANLNL